MGVVVLAIWVVVVVVFVVVGVDIGSNGGSNDSVGDCNCGLMGEAVAVVVVAIEGLAIFGNVIGGGGDVIGCGGV